VDASDRIGIILAKLTQKNPADRYDSYETLLGVLQRHDNELNGVTDSSGKSGCAGAALLIGGTLLWLGGRLL
jgi:hypothetical protein